MENSIKASRDKWIYNGVIKPPFYVIPSKSQVSVWDFPRPPALIQDSRKVEIYSYSVLILSTTSTLKVCETASPPTWYFPINQLILPLDKVPGMQSGCEWKGQASYYSLDSKVVGWSYNSPFPEYHDLKGMISFYASKVDCYVDGQKVIPQKSDFYGGWVTPEVIGPFKGDPGVVDLTR